MEGVTEMHHYAGIMGYWTHALSWGISVTLSSSLLVTVFVCLHDWLVVGWVVGWVVGCMVVWLVVGWASKIQSSQDPPVCTPQCWSRAHCGHAQLFVFMLTASALTHQVAY